MIKTISIYDFRDAFKAAGRGEQFSYDGLEVIFDYIESYEQDAGEQVELDVIALCCEWAEDNYASVAEQYDIDIDGLDEDDAIAAVVDYLNNNVACAVATDAGDIVYVQS
tara:strand:+ start:1070 stop:1399 length:330 start_codon:yes stop_codon:yes gene_type:complete